LDEETRATADRLGAIVGEREAGRQALAEASRLTEERARTADALAAALERHRETLAAERDRAEATRLEQVRVAAERVDLMRHAGELRERAAQLRRRAERLAAELSDATAEAAGIDALRASLVQARDVAQTERGARAAVEYLGAHSLGAATFLPLEHLPPPTGPQPDANDVRWVARAVGAPSLSLVHHLLGQVAIVEHLDQAEALWRRNGVVATYVTP